MVEAEPAQTAFPSLDPAAPTAEHAPHIRLATSQIHLPGTSTTQLLINTLSGLPLAALARHEIETSEALRDPLYQLKKANDGFSGFMVYEEGLGGRASAIFARLKYAATFFQGGLHFNDLRQFTDNPGTPDPNLTHNSRYTSAMANSIILDFRRAHDLPGNVTLAISAHIDEQNPQLSGVMYAVHCNETSVNSSWIALPYLGGKNLEETLQGTFSLATIGACHFFASWLDSRYLGQFNLANAVEKTVPRAVTPSELSNSIWELRRDNRALWGHIAHIAHKINADRRDTAGHQQIRFSFAESLSAGRCMHALRKIPGTHSLIGASMCVYSNALKGAIRAHDLLLTPDKIAKTDTTEALAVGMSMDPKFGRAATIFGATSGFGGNDDGADIFSVSTLHRRDPKPLIFSAHFRSTLYRGIKDTPDRKVLISEVVVHTMGLLVCCDIHRLYNDAKIRAALNPLIRDADQRIRGFAGIDKGGSENCFEVSVPDYRPRR
jgi:hypothetical protein